MSSTADTADTSDKPLNKRKRDTPPPDMVLEDFENEEDYEKTSNWLQSVSTGYSILIEYNCIPEDLAASRKTKTESYMFKRLISMENGKGEKYYYFDENKFCDELQDRKNWGNMRKVVAYLWNKDISPLRAFGEACSEDCEEEEAEEIIDKYLSYEMKDNWQDDDQLKEPEQGSDQEDDEFSFC